MLKRLIEVSLPLKEVSEQSAREKVDPPRAYLNSTHLVGEASADGVPGSSVCLAHSRPRRSRMPRDVPQAGDGTSEEDEFKPRNCDGSTVEDTPRNRCLEFIKHLVKWENSNNPEYIEPARKLITAAHKFLHPQSEEMRR